MEWVTALYSTVDLGSGPPVKEWTMHYPQASPHQTYGLNCGPNTLMFIYIYITHRRASTTQDWDPYNPDSAVAQSQVHAMRSFLLFHLLTQGGRQPLTFAGTSVLLGISQETARTLLQPFSKYRRAAHIPQLGEGKHELAEPTQRPSSSKIYDVG